MIKMVIAYVLLISKPGTETQVLESLQQKPEIVEVKLLYGEYDLIAKVKVEDVKRLNEFLLENIRQTPNIEKTSTLIVAN